MTSIYDFSMRTIDGDTLPLSMFRGKVMLIVNVASECHYTPQYADLVKLYNRLQDDGRSEERRVGKECRDRV